MAGSLDCGRQIGEAVVPERHAAAGWADREPAEHDNQQAHAEGQDLEAEDQRQDEHGGFGSGEGHDAGNDVEDSGEGEPSPTRDLRPGHEGGRDPADPVKE
jgi:hypothetical protein